MGNERSGKRTMKGPRGKKEPAAAEKRDIGDAAAARLARGEMTSKELVIYLVRKGYERSDAEETAAEFRELGYIDEARYAALFAAGAEHKGWGRNRLRLELVRHGVDEETASRAIEEALGSGALSSDGERALEVARRMLGAGEEPDEKMRARIARRLSGYGYGTAVIYDTLRKLGTDDPED